MKQTYTPIVYIENWLDNNIYIKRDDLTVLQDMAMLDQI